MQLAVQPPPINPCPVIYTTRDAGSKSSSSNLLTFDLFNRFTVPVKYLNSIPNDALPSEMSSVQDWSRGIRTQQLENLESTLSSALSLVLHDTDTEVEHQVVAGCQAKAKSRLMEHRPRSVSDRHSVHSPPKPIPEVWRPAITPENDTRPGYRSCFLLADVVVTTASIRSTGLGGVRPLSIIEVIPERTDDMMEISERREQERVQDVEPEWAISGQKRRPPEIITSDLTTRRFMVELMSDPLTIAP